VYFAYNSQVKALTNHWWPHIRSSGVNLASGHRIRQYTNSLKPGDVTLLGVIVDGGQGMATGNNGRYLAVLGSSPLAAFTKANRVDRISDFILSHNVKDFGESKDAISTSLSRLAEAELFDLVENWKVQFGRDIFGKGFVYRIAADNQVAEVSKLSDIEKENGILGSAFFVPYDKGDRAGNSWILPTPFYIDWSESSVSELKKGSGIDAVGSAVVRNPQFYFRAGVCWILTLNESSAYLKARLREPGIFDVNAMSIFVENDLVTEKFLVTLLNSYFVFAYQKNFINNTSAFQINDAKQLPLVIPTRRQLELFESLFDQAADIKAQQYQEIGSDTTDLDKELVEIQKQVDLAVLELYGLGNIVEFAPLS
jgi:hypothetical protein